MKDYRDDELEEASYDLEEHIRKADLRKAAAEKARKEHNKRIAYEFSLKKGKK